MNKIYIKAAENGGGFSFKVKGTAATDIKETWGGEVLRKEGDKATITITHTLNPVNGFYVNELGYDVSDGRGSYIGGARKEGTKAVMADDMAGAMVMVLNDITETLITVDEDTKERAAEAIVLNYGDN